MTPFFCLFVFWDKKFWTPTETIRTTGFTLFYLEKKLWVFFFKPHKKHFFFTCEHWQSRRGHWDFIFFFGCWKPIGFHFVSLYEKISLLKRIFCFAVLPIFSHPIVFFWSEVLDPIRFFFAQLRVFYFRKPHFF